MDILKPNEAERGVLVGMLSGRPEHAKTADVLMPADFTDTDAGKVFEACKAIHGRGEKVELLSLDNELSHTNAASEAERLMQYAVGLLGNGAALQAYRTPQYVAVIQESIKRRKLIAIGEALAAGAADQQRDADEVLNEARNALQQSVTSDGRWSTMLDAIFAAYNAVWNKDKPMSTGIQQLDQILCGGLHKGEFTLVGARPAVGKSALLLSIARDVAKQGLHVAFVSLEMNSEQIGNRVMSAESGINCARFRNHELLMRSEQAQEDFAAAVQSVDGDTMKRISLRIDGTLTVEKLRSEVQKLVDAGQCDLLVIDYLQLLNVRQKVNSDLQRLETISRALKAITLDCNVAVLAAAQLKRPANDGTPDLDELRGSGSLEQDADNVILMSAPNAVEEMANASEYKQRLIYLDVRKQRQGRPGRAAVMFDGAHTRYHDAN